MNDNIYGVHHIQLAIPAGGEGQARAFYGGVLGLPEIPKPEELAKRGGVWFQAGGFQIHLGIDKEFHAAVRAHPGLLVRDLDAICSQCPDVEFGYEVEGYRRAHVFDPFGNRIELLEKL
jgi:catechol 2,3-dioxygenase-like lactoylglutathione lyase family enzyme